MGSLETMDTNSCQFLLVVKSHVGIMNWCIFVKTDGIVTSHYSENTPFRTSLYSVVYRTWTHTLRKHRRENSLLEVSEVMLLSVLLGTSRETVRKTVLLFIRTGGGLPFGVYTAIIWKAEYRAVCAIGEEFQPETGHDFREELDVNWRWQHNTPEGLTPQTH